MKAAFFVISPLLFLLSGCAYNAVFDNTSPPANLSREGDKFYLSGAYGTNGYTLTGGIAIFSPLQVAIATQSNITKGDRNLPSGDARYTNYKSSNSLQAFEYIAGVFFPLPDNGVIEAFAGLGEGDGEDYSYSKETWNRKTKDILRISKGNYEKMFLQMNIGKRKTLYAYGFSLRWNRVIFSEYEKWHSERGIGF